MSKATIKIINGNISPNLSKNIYEWIMKKTVLIFFLNDPILQKISHEELIEEVRHSNPLHCGNRKHALFSDYDRVYFWQSKSDLTLLVSKPYSQNCKKNSKFFMSKISAIAKTFGGLRTNSVPETFRLFAFP